MSAIDNNSPAIGPDGVARYRSRVKLIVHSHNSPTPIDLSNSVIQVNTNKQLKVVGSMNVSLSAEINWMNLLNPNDYINLYFERGDGAGWVRTFFGYIDTIEESSTVDANGTPRTSYMLTASDFQKAFEKTQIYFNPHVAARADFSGGFIGTPNTGGMALMNRGILLNGTPADMVINCILLLVGFGTQFTLPASYVPRNIDRIRQQRAEFILNRLPNDTRNAILSAGGWSDFLERIRQEQGIASPLDALTNPEDSSPQGTLHEERARFSQTTISALDNPSARPGTESGRVGTERSTGAYNALNTTLAGYPPTLLDIIDIQTFIERTSIDGYNSGAPMWDRQENVLGFLNFISNEIVNELFFDLRFQSRDGGLSEGTEFSRDDDDLAGNRGADGIADGYQITPAIIMREYPFSTISRLDGSHITLRTGGSTAEGTLGEVPFGAIFSNLPNQPGRHVVQIQNINIDDLVRGEATSLAKKHLDVAVVHETEIINSKLSRSDSEHFNLLEVISTAMLGEAARFYMQDLLPIITPVHISRHGLRVRSLTTRSATFSLQTLNRTQPVTEAPEEDAGPEAVTTAGTPVPPVAYVAGTSGWQTSAFGYRRRVNRATTPRFNGTSAPIPIGDAVWRFHNGMDWAGPSGTDVVAVRDGWVVCAAPPQDVDSTGWGRPEAGFNGYGGTVIIYHDDVSPEATDGTTAEGAIFTLYAHLSKIESSLIQGTNQGVRNRCAPELKSGGRYRKVRVSAGQKIGEIGRTGFEDRHMAPHLHFEVIKRQGGQAYPSMRRDLTPDMLTSRSQYSSEGGWAPASALLFEGTAPPPIPTDSRMLSQDPAAQLASWGIAVRRPDGSSPALDPDDAYPGDAGEDSPDLDAAIASTETADDRTQAQQSAQTIQAGFVDTPDVRRQVARWSLLQDHWYQHNLEYLSGSIDMRGAPEIRVGYRLDIPERHLSAYVEAVSHSWTINQVLVTTVHITRGQPNNPFPAYVLPFIEGFQPTETQRLSNSRLSKFFITPDPIAVRKALKLNGSLSTGTILPVTANRGIALTNFVDLPDSNDTTLKDKYSEIILPSEAIPSYTPEPPAVDPFNSTAATGASPPQDIGDLSEEGFDDFIRSGG